MSGIMIRARRAIKSSLFGEKLESGEGVRRERRKGDDDGDGGCGDDEAVGDVTADGVPSLGVIAPVERERDREIAVIKLVDILDRGDRVNTIG